ncbi:MAG: hypothetical protein FRX49_08941 [Trebouxia sp. A1-2]|nr:MAG: hypothetical protein FRX49_08941 [Trebouxia sp. A1-2]
MTQQLPPARDQKGETSQSGYSRKACSDCAFESRWEEVAVSNGHMPEKLPTTNAPLRKAAGAALPADAWLVDAAITAVLGEAEEDWLVGLTAPSTLEMVPGALGLFDAEAPLTTLVSPDAEGLLLAVDLPDQADFLFEFD